jgi:hypothetical protein
MIVTKLPATGTRMAWSYHEFQGKNCFAWVPIHPETGSVRKAIYFETEAEAQAHMEAQIEVAVAAGQPFDKLDHEVVEMLEPDA